MPSIRNNSKSSKLRTHSYIPVRKMFKKHNCFIVAVLCGILALITIFTVFTPEPSSRTQYAESLTSSGSLRTYLESQRKTHQALKISDQFVTELANSININEFQTVLEPILVERVVGTKSHENVKNFIVNQFTSLDWAIELDTFEDDTPHAGKMPFTNIIATHNPNAERYLVLACHYDSKLSDFKFIAATDSAVPCAMLIYIARILDKSLKQLESKLALKLVFFDGEEAFVHWTETDSLYGARHLAGVWHSRTLLDSDATDLHSIDLFVLLDLMGAASPTFYDYNEHSKRWFKLLVNIERRLGRLRLIEKEDTSVDKQQYYFHDIPMYDARIEDDHIPFLKKGVPVVHLIPMPFPDVWHTAGDDRTVINFHSVKNLLRVIEIFVWQYVHGSVKPSS